MAGALDRPTPLFIREIDMSLKWGNGQPRPPRDTTDDGHWLLAAGGALLVLILKWWLVTHGQ